MKIHQIPCWEDNYSYVLHLNNEVLVIDPCDPEKVINALKELNFSQLSIINTHHHPDHINGNIAITNYCRTIWNRSIDIYCSLRDKDRVPLANHFWPLEDQNICIGEFCFLKLHTPGHTEGHFSLYFQQDSALFCGDVLFSLGCGRIFEGTTTELFNSHQKLLALSPLTQVYCAHEYTMDNLLFTEWVFGHKQEELRAYVQTQLAEKNSTIPSTLEFELKHNLFLSCRNPEVQQLLALKIGLKTPLPPLELFKILRNTRNLGSKPPHFVI